MYGFPEDKSSLLSHIIYIIGELAAFRKSVALQFHYINAGGGNLNCANDVLGLVSGLLAGVIVLDQIVWVALASL